MFLRFISIIFLRISARRLSAAWILKSELLQLIMVSSFFHLRTTPLIYLFCSFELFFLLQIDFLLLFCLLWLNFKMKNGINIVLYHLWLICGLNFKNWFEWILLFLSFGPFTRPRFNQPISSVYKILDWRKHHAVPKSLNGQIIYWIYIWNVSPSGHPLF